MENPHSCHSFNSIILVLILLIAYMEKMHFIIVKILKTNNSPDLTAGSTSMFCWQKCYGDGTCNKATNTYC